MRPFIEAVSRNTEAFVLCYPNAGKESTVLTPCSYRCYIAALCEQSTFYMAPGSFELRVSVPSTSASSTLFRSA